MKSAKTCDSQEAGLLRGRLEGIAPQTLADFGGGSLGAPEAYKISPTPNPLQFIKVQHTSGCKKSVLVSPGRSDPGPSASNKAFTPRPLLPSTFLDSLRFPSLFQVLMKVQPNSG